MNYKKPSNNYKIEQTNHFDISNICREILNSAPKAKSKLRPNKFKRKYEGLSSRFSTEVQRAISAGVPKKELDKIFIKYKKKFNRVLEVSTKIRVSTLYENSEDPLVNIKHSESTEPLSLDEKITLLNMWHAARKNAEQRLERKHQIIKNQELKKRAEEAEKMAKERAKKRTENREKMFGGQTTPVPTVNQTRTNQSKTMKTTPTSGERE